MKTTKLTILGYTSGALIGMASLYRWTIFYNDLKQTLTGIAIAIGILGFAYLYQRVTELRDEIVDTHRGLDAMRVWSLDEFEKLKKKE